MALQFGFYDSLNGDRVYNAEEFSIPFSHIIEEGVFANYGLQYKVNATGGMGITVDKGASWFAATWSRLDAPQAMQITAAAPSFPRIDRVVLRHSSKPSERANYLTILQGVPASVPAPMALANGDGVYDMLIADIRVPAGATEIAAGNITRYPGTAKTPYVTAPLTSVDVSPIIEQFNETFDAWFESIQTLLEGDVAANLALKVQALEAADTSIVKDMKTLESKIATREADTGWVPVSVLSGWKTTGAYSARVIGNKLYFSGTQQRTKKSTSSVSIAIKIADWPTVIKDALLAAGWDSSYRAMGNGNSTTGHYCLMSASSDGLWMQYRNRNPNVGEWVSSYINGGIM